MTNIHFDNLSFEITEGRDISTTPEPNSISLDCPESSVLFVNKTLLYPNIQSIQVRRILTNEEEQKQQKNAAFSELLDILAPRLGPYPPNVQKG